MAGKILKLITIMSMLALIFFKYALAAIPVTWVSDNRFITGKIYLIKILLCTVLQVVG